MRICHFGVMIAFWCQFGHWAWDVLLMLICGFCIGPKMRSKMWPELGFCKSFFPQPRMVNPVGHTLFPTVLSGSGSLTLHPHFQTQHSLSIHKVLHQLFMAFSHFCSVFYGRMLILLLNNFICFLGFFRYRVCSQILPSFCKLSNNFPKLSFIYADIDECWHLYSISEAWFE